jgi:hypothetical protein
MVQVISQKKDPNEVLKIEAKIHIKKEKKEKKSKKVVTL